MKSMRIGEYVPRGVRPGEYGGLRDTLGLYEQVHTRFGVAQLEQSRKGEVILALLN